MFLLEYLLDLNRRRSPKIIFLIIEFVYLPMWFIYRIHNTKNKNFFYIPTEIFGEQLSQFQLLNYFAKKTSSNIYFNHHPIVSGSFIYNKTISQVLLNNNVKLTSRLNIVNRIYSQNIEDFLSRKFSLKKRNFIFSFRHLGFSSSLLNSYLVPKFPNFSQKDLLNSRKLVSKHAPNISVDKYIIGVNLRSKGYIQHNLLSQYMMNFRNASINDISESIKVLNTDRNIFVRFGHFDNETAYIKNFVDLRKQLLTNNELQLSLFASINAYFGTANGPVSFFVNQKKPCLLVSTYPIDFEYPTDPHAVIIIPKLVWDQFNKRYFSLEELFDLDFLKMQNLYNDHALIKNGLRIESPPSTLTAKIFAGWQDSILLQKNTNWLKLSVEASSNLRKKLNLPKLATIPIDYFDYVKSL